MTVRMMQELRRLWEVEAGKIAKVITARDVARLGLIHVQSKPAPTTRTTDLVPSLFNDVKWINIVTTQGWRIRSNIIFIPHTIYYTYLFCKTHI